MADDVHKSSRSHPGISRFTSDHSLSSLMNLKTAKGACPHPTSRAARACRSGDRVDIGFAAARGALIGRLGSGMLPSERAQADGSTFVQSNTRSSLPCAGSAAPIEDAGPHADRVAYVEHQDWPAASRSIGTARCPRCTSTRAATCIERPILSGSGQPGGECSPRWTPGLMPGAQAAGTGRIGLVLSCRFDAD